MSQTTATSETQNNSSDNQATKSATEQDNQVRYGEEAFTHVMPLSEVAFQVSTPIGKSLKCRSKYIGVHSKHLLLFEIPSVSQSDLAVFFQRGYTITACVISSVGEGEKIYFKSKIEYVINTGDVSMFLVSVPSSTQIAGGLREEARLRIAIDGELDPNGKQCPCTIKDISAKGCLIQVDRHLCDYKVHQDIELIIKDGFDNNNCQTLTASIRNRKQSKLFWNFGVLFDDEAQQHVAKLHDRLEFCRVTQTFSIGK